MPQRIRSDAAMDDRTTRLCDEVSYFEVLEVKARKTEAKKQETTSKRDPAELARCVARRAFFETFLVPRGLPLSRNAEQEGFLVESGKSRWL